MSDDLTERLSRRANETRRQMDAEEQAKQDADEQRRQQDQVLASMWAKSRDSADGFRRRRIEPLMKRIREEVLTGGIGDYIKDEDLHVLGSTYTYGQAQCAIAVTYSPDKLTVRVSASVKTEGSRAEPYNATREYSAGEFNEEEANSWVEERAEHLVAYLVRNGGDMPAPVTYGKHRC